MLILYVAGGRWDRSGFIRLTRWDRHPLLLPIGSIMTLTIGNLGSVTIYNPEQFREFLLSVDSPFANDDFSKITYPISIPTTTRFEYDYEGND